MYQKTETERLIIRPIEKSDDVFIHELVNSEGWLKNIGDKQVRTIKDANIFIEKVLDTAFFFYHVLEHKDTHQPVGIVSFIKRQEYTYPDFGFALLPTFYKQGYAYEASYPFLKKLISRDTNLTIIAFALSSNSSSISLLTKLGFELNLRQKEKNGQEISHFTLNTSRYNETK